MTTENAVKLPKNADLVSVLQFPPLIVFVTDRRTDHLCTYLSI